MPLTVNTTGSNSFPYLKLIWNVSLLRKYLVGGVTISLLSFILFKFLYPYPDFFSDSYSYIFAAYAHLNISIWPIGYSKFLAIIHHISHSATILVAIQYFFIQIALLHFFFTIIYFFSPGKWTQTALFLFLFINPLTLYIANTINSDALFAAFSFLWITELIWIIQEPRTYQLFLQAALLFFCFTIRNNAYYYPVLAGFVYVLSKQSLWKKTIGILLPFIFIILFILFTRKQCFKLTSTTQFSLFTGWQLANNALYIYDKVKVDSSTLTTPQSRELNRIAIKYFTHINSPGYRQYLESYVGNFFIRQPEAPLKQYYSGYFSPKSQLDNIATWAKASQIFEGFGKVIILQHPFAYVQYFIFPNASNYFIPPLSHLQRYNYGGNSIDPIAQFWFDYRQPRVHVFSHNFQGSLLIVYQPLFLLLNFYYLWQLISLFRLKKFSSPKEASKFLINKVMALFFFLNLGFSLVTTINILRYQFVPMFVLLAVVLTGSDLIPKFKTEKEGLFKSLSFDQNV